MSDSIRISGGLDFSADFFRCSKVISSNNLEISSLALSNKTLSRIMKGFELNLADGRGFQLLYLLANRRWVPKHSGSDIYLDLVTHSIRANTGVLIFGGSQQANEKAVNILRADFDSDAIIGLSPAAGMPFRSCVRMLIECLETHDIGLCLVCFGAPWQEYMSYLAKKFCKKEVVYMCAGGTVDFISGEIVRAPKWMQFLGLEWLYRLLLQPRVRGPRILKALGLLFKNFKAFPTLYS